MNSYRQSYSHLNASDTNYTSMAYLRLATELVNTNIGVRTLGRERQLNELTLVLSRVQIPA